MFVQVSNETWYSVYLIKLRTPDTKLLQVIEEEQCKDAMSCEHLTELLFKLSAKEENYRELMLLIETEEEIPIKNWKWTS